MAYGSLLDLSGEAPNLEVRKDLQVPSMGQDGPHGSYFMPGNELVQKTVIAQRVLS